MDAQHSGCGLFPTESQRLLLAVSQKDLANDRESLVLFRNPQAAFNDEVVDSSLLSRGWVYQEILLAPANLYCTYAQMWWSCAHASLSEAFPIHDNRQQRFIDRIQEKKNAMMGRIERFGPTKSWMSVLHGYTPTTITFDGDRLIALKGISSLFRGLYPNHLQNAEYHSGLWSTDIMEQLPWERIPEEHHPPDRESTSDYPIPSWSPLKDIGRRSTTSTYSLLSNPVFSDMFMLPNRFVSMDTSQLDEFGRATSWESCQMHLQGVLVHVKLIDSYPHEKLGLRAYQMAHAVGHAYTRVTIIWDNAEEQALAASAPDHQLQALTICAGYRRFDSSEVDFLLCGILLRAFNAQARSQSPGRTRRWVRCGSFQGIFLRTHGGSMHASQAQKEVSKYENAFQITQKYGISWELENPEEDDKHKWRWRQRYLHDPELEDIYIV